jgi:hypothetical protein
MFFVGTLGLTELGGLGWGFAKGGVVERMLSSRIPARLSEANVTQRESTSA